MVDEKRAVGGRREAEEQAEAPREGVENVPRGGDIQDIVPGQEPDPNARRSPRRTPP